MIAKFVRASALLMLSGTLMSCLHEENDYRPSHELAQSLFRTTCLDLMPDHVAIIRHAAAQGWSTLPEGERIDPPQRLTRGPDRSWRIEEGGMTVVLGLEILGDPELAERMLKGEDAGGSGMIFCNVHFAGGDYEGITGNISQLSFEPRALGPPGMQMGAGDGWANRLWGIGRGGWQAINFVFDPNGNGRFIEISADIRLRS